MTYLGDCILLTNALMAFDQFTVGGLFKMDNSELDEDSFGDYYFQARTPYGWDGYEIDEGEFLLIHLGHINENGIRKN